MHCLHLLVSLAFLPSICLSNTIWVPDDYSTIQEAINATVDGDEVVVRPGTYVENIDFIGKGITVRSLSGPGVTTIQGVLDHPKSVVTFRLAEGPDSVLSGFGIKGGGVSGFNGGGIRCRNSSSPTIVGNEIFDSSADLGGGISCENSSAPIIQGNVIRDNRALEGGGVSCTGISSAVITGNTIQWNLCDRFGGGGIFCRSSSVIITGNTIRQNRAYGAAGDLARGGGIYCLTSSPTIAGNTISENLIWEDNGLGGRGGGIHCRDSSSTITDNLIIKNRVESPVGGLTEGAGIYFDGGAPVVDGNTIAENSCDGSAYDRGGGIHFLSCSATVTNTILWDNSASVGPEILVGMYTYPSTVTISYSNVKGGQSSVYVYGGSTLNWGAGMIDADPLFIDPANGDHRLQQDPCQPGIANACVDGGDPSSSLLHGTTRTDLVQDVGVVDIGFHHDLSAIPGIPFCYGDQGFGTPCPCSNDNDGVVPGSGCANGAFTSGARLTGSGTASVSSDTLVLTTVRQEPSNSGLFFQAENDLSPGSTWGDGLRCAGGGLRRLQVRFADQDGTLSTTLGISIKAGNISPGDTKYYQCWYRTTANPPCGTGVNDFNTSNGYAITWWP